MKPTLTSALVLVVLSVLFTVLPERGATLTAIGISVAAALILVLGIWLAPAAGGKPFATSGGPDWQTAKSVQLTIGGLVATCAIAFLTDNAGWAAVVGIFAALILGFAMPSHREVGDSPAE
ncbi:hypothetical protein AAEX63_04445 [Luteococcus sp. H138]|uniref:hypothetical protein n=1 Tax=unclassified Luteococcus TaxID=2639923 RepID=UPI00313BD21E